jgi:hypothetical protein
MNERLEGFCDRRSLVMVSQEKMDPTLVEAAEHIYAHREEKVVWFISRYMPGNLHYLFQTNSGTSGYGSWQPFKVELARCGDAGKAGSVLKEILSPLAANHLIEFEQSEDYITVSWVMPEAVVPLRDLFNGLWQRYLLGAFLSRLGYEVHCRITLSSGVTESTAWLPLLALEDKDALICESMRGDVKEHTRGMSKAAESLLLQDLPLLLVGTVAVPAPPAYTCSFDELGTFVKSLSLGKRLMLTAIR